MFWIYSKCYVTGQHDRLWKVLCGQKAIQHAHGYIEPCVNTWFWFIICEMLAILIIKDTMTSLVDVSMRSVAYILK